MTFYPFINFIIFAKDAFNTARCLILYQIIYHRILWLKYSIKFTREMHREQKEKKKLNSKKRKIKKNSDVQL